MAVCECACYQACRIVCLLIQKAHQKAGIKKHDPGFEGLIKSKSKVIKPAKHLSFLKQHVKKKDVINVLIPKSALLYLWFSFSQQHNRRGFTRYYPESILTTGARANWKSKPAKTHAWA